MEVIRTAIVGYGLSGRVFHAPFVRANGRFRLEAVVTSDSERARQAQGDNSRLRTLPSFDHLVSLLPELELVVLSGPPHTHYEQASALLAAGVAVIVDKPFVPTLVEAQALARQSAQTGAPLFVFQNRRWDGDFLTIQDLVRREELGDVFQFESSFEHWAPTVSPGWKDSLPRSQGGGVMYDLGSHLVDQALVLFGPAAEVRSDLRTVRDGGGNDDVAFLELRHHTGVKSELRMSRVGSQRGPRFRVSGTEGSYISYGLDGQEPALAHGMSPADPNFGSTPEERWGTMGIDAEGPAPAPVATKRGRYSAFYDGVAAALLDGSDVPPVTMESAIDVVRILEIASQNTGSWVAIDGPTS